MAIEERVAREAILLTALDVKVIPLDETLRNWVGVIESESGQVPYKIAFQLILTNGFPDEPPRLIFLNKFKHSCIKNGTLDLNVLNFWRSKFHASQLINALRGIFYSEPPVMLSSNNDDLGDGSSTRVSEIISTIEDITSLENKVKSFRQKLMETALEVVPKSPLPDRDDPDYLSKMPGFIVEHLSRIEKTHGNMITLRDFFSSFREFYNDNETTLKTMTFILSKLEREKIISGIETMAGRVKIITLKPTAMSNDVNLVLKIASENEQNMVTEFTLMSQLKWDLARCKSVLKMTEKLGVSVYFEDRASGGRWYFPSVKK